MNSNHKNSAIALFDSGVGGLTILSKVKRELPFEKIIYFADSANCPYGGKSKEDIISISKGVVEQLIPHGVKMVVVACNTATTNAIHRLREMFPDIIFVGTEPAVKPALLGTKSGVVGVLATHSTISSHQVQHLTERFGEGKEVIEVAGEGLVEFIESNREDSSECEELLRGYIEPMIERGADYIALGCTHYPFLINSLKRILGNRDISIVEPASAIARQAKKMLIEKDLLTEKRDFEEVIFLSSCKDTRYIKRLKEKFSRWQQV